MTASNFTDDLRVPRIGEEIDAFPVDCEPYTANGVIYKRQRVVEASSAAILSQLTTTATETIDTVHKYVHTGRFFSGGCNLASVADLAYLDILIQTGDISPHVVISGAAAGDALVSLYEGATFSAAGDAITLSNHNRNSAKVADLTAHCSPTITNVGSSLNGVRFIPGGQKSGSSGGEGGFGAEYVLAPNTVYLFRMQNIAGAAKRMSQMLEFYLPGL